MAKGDQNDMHGRIKALIPKWFGDDAPVFNALLQGPAYALSFIYGLLVYAAQQIRIRTAFGGWLDMIAADFFGASLTRKPGESDSRFRSRIIINLFRERGTRAGLIKVLTELTGREPVVFEPMRPADTGCYGGPLIGYGVAGGYGSLALPYQAFVDVFRPEGTGIPSIAGYGVSTGAYSTPSQASYASIETIQSSAADDEIYEAIDAVKPVATIVWTRIH